MNCVFADKVEAYRDNELSPEQRAAFARHLGQCADCAREIEAFDALSQRLRATPRAAMPDDLVERIIERHQERGERGLRRITGWMSAAAAGVLVASLVGWPRESPGIAAGSVEKVKNWELVATNPSAPIAAEPQNELVQVAQWMADGLMSER